MIAVRGWNIANDILIINKEKTNIHYKRREYLIKVIGNENCSRCEMTKKLLKEKDIEFEYLLISSLGNQDEIMDMASEKGLMNFPLIMNGNEIIELQEVIN